MNFIMRLAAIVSLLLAATGCAPDIAMDAHTTMRVDGITERKTVFSGTPNKKFPDFNVRLSNYLTAKPQSEFDDVKVSDAEIDLAGEFDHEIPSDYYKTTESTKLVAQNHVSAKSYDIGIATAYLYEERFDDILTHQGGKQAAERLLNLLIETFLTACDDIYAEEYELTPLKQFFRVQVRGLGLTLYDKLWDIRSQHLSASQEASWWRKTLSEEGRKIGLTVEPEQLPGGADYNEDLFKNLLDQKLREMTQPKSGKGSPLTYKKLKKGGFGSALQDAIGKRYGSSIGFYMTIDKLLPQAFGAYAIAEIELFPLSPHLSFHHTVTLPGTIYYDNTAVEKTDNTQKTDATESTEHENDSRSWEFTHREIALHGKTLQACSIVWNNKQMNQDQAHAQGTLIAQTLCLLDKMGRENAAKFLAAQLPNLQTQQDSGIPINELKTALDTLHENKPMYSEGKKVSAVTHKQVPELNDAESTIIEETSP